MEKILLDKFEPIEIFDDASLVLLRSYCQKIGWQMEMSPESLERVSIIASELGQNQIKHTRSGTISINHIKIFGGEGIEILAADHGPGFSPIEEIFRKNTHFSHGSLGAGLSGILRMADEVHFDIRREEGCTIRVRIFKKPPSIKTNIGIYARPRFDVRPCGDSAGVKYLDSDLAFAVIDGLGHGPLARESADLLISGCFSSNERDPYRILSSGTRALNSKHLGGTGALAYFDGLQKEIHIGRAGDVMALVINGTKVSLSIKHTPPLSFSIQPRPIPKPERIPLLGRECWLALFTDGLSLHASDCPASYFKEPHPIATAEKMSRQFDKGQDDALVLIAHMQW